MAERRAPVVGLWCRFSLGAPPVPRAQGARAEDDGGAEALRRVLDFTSGSHRLFFQAFGALTSTRNARR